MVAERTQIQFTQTADATSHFVRKSVLQTLGKDFRFDFPVDKLQQLDLNNDESAKKPKYETDNALNSAPVATIIQSDNSFKFNFNIEKD